MCSREVTNNQERSENAVLGTSPISPNPGSEIHGLSQDLAVSNCANLIESVCDKTDSEQIDNLRTAS